MKNRNCPNIDACWDYDASNCEGCAIGQKIEKFARKIKRLQAENAELRARIDKAVELPCKVGDTVWEVFNNALIFERKVYHINLREKETTFCLSGKSGIIHLGIVELIDYNKLGSPTAPKPKPVLRN